MPYLLSRWALLAKNASSSQTSQESQCSLNVSRSSSSSVSVSSTKGRLLRSVPHDTVHQEVPPTAASTETVSTDASVESLNGDCLEMRQIVALKEIVTAQVEELHRSIPARSTHHESFYGYALATEKTVFSGTYSNIYQATQQDSPQCPLVARVYEPSSRIDPQRSIYLKILKSLGKRHHSLISTWDIYYDTFGRVVIFQELALQGNLAEYIKANNTVSEPLMGKWAQQIYRALDFLGQTGICHRAIQPKHILLSSSADEASPTACLVAKLASFRDSILYYDARGGQVRHQPCRPLDRRLASLFQAPEVFGYANEVYDPISADVWSYGATFFFAATRSHPIRYKSPPPDDVSLQIEKNIEMSSTVSSGGKRWFRGLLNANATLRTTFHLIEADPWFKTV